jgi:Na+/melibiose symporter-like transporter
MCIIIIIIIMVICISFRGIHERDVGNFHFPGHGRTKQKQASISTVMLMLMLMLILMFTLQSIHHHFINIAQLVLHNGVSGGALRVPRQ